jgi:hypothetical protein
VPTGDLSVELYDFIKDCCDAYGVPWLSETVCFAASGIDVTWLGSNSFYVQNQKCVQDCVGAAPCGVWQRNGSSNMTLKLSAVPVSHGLLKESVF